MSDALNGAVVLELETNTCSLIHAGDVNTQKHIVLYQGPEKFCLEVKRETTLPEFYVHDYLVWKLRTKATVYYNDCEFFYGRNVDCIVMSNTKAAAMRAVDAHRGDAFDLKIRTYFEQNFRPTLNPELIRIAQTHPEVALFSSARGELDFAIHEPCRQFPRPAWNNPYIANQWKELFNIVRRPISTAESKSSC